MQLPILKNWPDYFENPHEGLGTTYERFVLNNHFKRIQSAFSIRNVLEVPSFGMTGISGINSLWWATTGSQVTVVDNNLKRLLSAKSVWSTVALKADFVYLKDINRFEFKDKAFDLSWNFGSLWFIPDLNVFFQELTRVTRKVIFICVPNRSGLGHLTRLAINGGKNDSFFLDNLKKSVILNGLKNQGWLLRETGYFDIPPWPDIAMKKEELFKKIGLNRIIRLFKREKEGVDRRLCILDYLTGASPNMENEIMRYSWLENAPWLIKKFWAHHRYFIFEKGK